MGAPLQWRVFSCSDGTARILRGPEDMTRHRSGAPAAEDLSL